MKKRFKNLMGSSTFSSFSSSIIAILGGLVIGFLILLITNPAESGIGFLTIIKGGFTGGAKGIGDMLYHATPIIMTGLAVGFAFKTGLFNIGASGQFIVGAYIAVMLGNVLTLGGAHWAVALLGAMLGGALWALIPGLLKSFFNVHEVISSIMMNYIGMYAVNMTIKETIYDSLKARAMAPKATATLPKLGLDKLFDGSSVNSGIIIAIGFVILIYIILQKTTFGYELKACGYNANASRYAGINAKRNIVLSMVISGALAGIGGGLMYLAGAGRQMEVVDVIASEGFTGISVALLGLSHPIGILFSGLFIAHIAEGGFFMQHYNYVPEVIDIMVAIIIYFSAFALIVKLFFERYTLKLNTKIEDDQTGKNVAMKRRRRAKKPKQIEKTGKEE